MLDPLRVSPTRVGGLFPLFRVLPSPNLIIRPDGARPAANSNNGLALAPLRIIPSCRTAQLLRGAARGPWRLKLWSIERQEPRPMAAGGLTRGPRASSSAGIHARCPKKSFTKKMDGRIFFFPPSRITGRPSKVRTLLLRRAGTPTGSENDSRGRILNLDFPLRPYFRRATPSLENPTLIDLKKRSRRPAPAFPPFKLSPGPDNNGQPVFCYSNSTPINSARARRLGRRSSRLSSSSDRPVWQAHRAASGLLTHKLTTL